MRFTASASNVAVEMFNADNESVLAYQYDNVSVSMDFFKIVEMMPAIKDKIEEMQSQLDGR